MCSASRSFARSARRAATKTTPRRESTTASEPRAVTLPSIGAVGFVHDNGFFWFFYVAGIVRPGSELLLAWVQSFTGLTGHEVFMPTTLALHLGLISATGAMTHRLRPTPRAALVACALMGASALATLGRQLEDHFGQPLDVEWAFEGGQLYLLQSRPVTA